MQAISGNFTPAFYLFPDMMDTSGAGLSDVSGRALYARTPLRNIRQWTVTVGRFTAVILQTHATRPDGTGGYLVTMYDDSEVTHVKILNCTSARDAMKYADERVRLAARRWLLRVASLDSKFDTFGQDQSALFDLIDRDQFYRDTVLITSHFAQHYVSAS